METSKTSTGKQLNDLTLFAVDTPVSLSALQATEKAQTTHDICGLGSEMPLAHYNQSTQSWRMSEDISLWGDYKSLESLPKSGTTRNGVLYQQPEWVRPIDENASSSWPTPIASSGMSEDISTVRKRLDNGTPYKGRLVEAVAKWPTPTTMDSGNPLPPRKKNKKGGQKPPLVSVVGGKLNPVWVEWLMGFPLGWTDLED